MGQSALRRIRYANAPADLYTDASAGFVFPKILSGEATWGSATYARRFQVADQDHFQDAVGERKPAGIKFQTELIGFGGAPAGAGNGVVAGDGESGPLFKSCFGNQTKDTGGLVGTGSTTTSIVLQAGEGAGFSIGNLVGFVLGGAFHVRQIRNKVTDTLTLDRALPSAPVNGETCYASSSFSKAADGHQHMWFDFEGFDATSANNYRRSIRGCLGNFQVRGGNLALVDWEFQGVDWVANQGTSMGAPTYPTNMPATGVGTNRACRLWVDAVEQKIAEFEYALGNEVKAQVATAAANGIAKFRIVDSGQTFRLRVLWEEGGEALVTKLRAGTLFDLLVEVVGGGAGNSFGLAAPKAQVVEAGLTSQDGLDYLDVSCKLLRGDGLTPAVPAVVFGML